MLLPTSQYIVYNNGIEFKFHFKTLCDSYGFKCKLTSVKNSQAVAILERVHQTIMGMLRNAEIDIADTVSESDIVDFLTNAAWAICFTYLMLLKASPGTAIFGMDMLLDILFIDNWNKIGNYKQLQTDRDTRHEKRHVLTGITKMVIQY